MPLPMFPLRAISIVGSLSGSLAETKEMMEIVSAGKVDPIPFASVRSRREPDADDLREGKITGRVVLTP